MGKLVKFDTWKQERRVKKAQRRKTTKPQPKFNLQVKIFFVIIFIVFLWFIIQTFIRVDKAMVMY